MDEDEASPMSQEIQPLVGEDEEADGDGDGDGDVDEVEESDLLGEDEDSNNLEVPVPLDMEDAEENDALSNDANNEPEPCDPVNSDSPSNQEKDVADVADDTESPLAGESSVQSVSVDADGEKQSVEDESNDDLQETCSNGSNEIVAETDISDVQIIENESLNEELLNKSGVDADAAESDPDTESAKEPMSSTIAGGTDLTLESSERLESEDEEIDMPMIRVKQVGLFAEEDEDEDDQGDQMNVSIEPGDVSNMMAVEMNEDSSPSKSSQGDATISSRPRRAAAAAAATVIREITSLEEEDNNVRRRKSKDKEVHSDKVAQPAEATGQERRRCHACKKVAASKVVVRQYGQDIYFCTSACFNAFRNPDSSRRPLPCAKCGIIQRDSNITSTYYWETMNFCSDLCVGNYQIEIGSRCATCIKKVAWASLGKYCVRFGSDVRQFCSAFCLETYKKNARVCFHCQLDIKKLSNVILANIPAKSSPKEFCSQDCVEMYIEQNLHQTVSRKPNQNSLCGICSALKVTFRELVIPTGNYKICSEFCWTKLLETKNIRRPVKCEICTKFVNLELGIITPAFYVSTEQKVHGFCSATCKNVYVLRSRQILACTTCKVKKYNYDLIEHIDESGSAAFAVCSLNCIPKPSQYILNLRETLTPVATASEMFSKSRQQERPQQANTATQSRIRTTIVSNSSNGDKNKSPAEENANDIRIACVSSLAKNTPRINSETGVVTLEEARDDDIIEIYGEGEDDGEGRCVDISEDEMTALLTSADSYVVFPPKEPIEQRNKGCLVRPYTTTVGTQVDPKALGIESGEPGGERIKEKIIPVFIPYFVPFPFYGLDSPVPVPLPVPIPVPIPLPVLLPTEPRTTTDRTMPVAPIPPNPPVITSAQQLQMLPQPLVSSTEMVHSQIPVIPVIPEGMRMDSVGFLDLAGPNVGESDNFDILTTIPNLDMDLDLGSAHHSSAANPIMNQSSMMMGSGNLGDTGLMRSVVDDLASSDMQWRQPTVLSPLSKIPAHSNLTRAQYAVSMWTRHFGRDADPSCLPEKALNEKLTELVQKGTFPNGERLPPYMILYLCLGLQQYLRTQNRPDKLFYDHAYLPFIEAFVSYAEITYQQGVIEPAVEENHFWDALELGANYPEVLVFTLVYYNYKYFHLRTWQEHADLQVTDYVITTKLGRDGLRYKSLSLIGRHAASHSVDEMESTTKCFIKLYEFYKFKCTISDSGPFYKEIIPLSPLKAKWYSTQALSQMDIYRMLIRAMMIKW